MDVEGYEVEIINGGRWTIERFHPLLLIEVHAGDLRTTINLLKNLKRAGYEVKYYIPRELNKPLIGSMNDVQEIDISQLIEKLSKGLLSDCFHLFLTTQ